MLFVFLFYFLPSFCFAAPEAGTSAPNAVLTLLSMTLNHFLKKNYFSSLTVKLTSFSFCNLPLLFLLSLLPLLPHLPQHISDGTLWNVNNSRCWHRLVVHIVKKSCADTIELLMYNNDSCIKEMKLLTKPWFCAFTSSRKDRFIHPSRMSMFLSHEHLHILMLEKNEQLSCCWRNVYMLKRCSDLKQTVVLAVAL